MTKQIILLAECPYCEDGGEVYLDTQEAGLENIRQLVESDFDVGPAQNVILYNTSNADRGPCEHVVDLYGDINWSGEPVETLSGRTSELCFAWRVPILTEIDPNELLFNHLLDLLSAEISQRMKDLATEPAIAGLNISSNDLLTDMDENEDEEPYPYELAKSNEHYLFAYQPKARYSEYRFGDCWQDFTTENKERRFNVQGTIIFAEDIRTFFQELHVLLEKRKRNWQSHKIT